MQNNEMSVGNSVNNNDFFELSSEIIIQQLQTIFMKVTQ